MTLLPSCAARAVRRDLARAQLLLTGNEPIGTDRRRVLAAHLAWLGVFGVGSDPVVAPIALQVCRYAERFGLQGDRATRDALAAAVASLGRATETTDGWLAIGALRDLQRHLPWLYDGTAPRHGAGSIPSVDPVEIRDRLRVYRQRRAFLWGAAALSARPFRSLPAITGR
jgi:hypothetical protein